MNEIVNKCTQCGSIRQEVEQYCLECGFIFFEGKTCLDHPSVPAEGVCAICAQAYCKDCGLWVNHVFLCDPHSNYEIVEGMAGVCSSENSSELEIAKTVMEQDNLHPDIYSKIIFVPCREVLRAEELINNINNSAT